MRIPPECLRSAYRYDLDPELIAQTPVTPRDSARLLVYDRAGDYSSHCRFSDVGDHLRPGDLLVVNTTRVLPARLHPARLDTGGHVEVFLLRERTPAVWEALVRPGRRLRPGVVLGWGDGTTVTITERLDQGARLVTFSRPIDLDWLESAGSMPLPPYIKRPDGALDRSDAKDYQTVYADEPGAVAAPTAGLHFTPELLERLTSAGVGLASLVLHVGPGTFRPVRVDDIREHPMHREHYRVPANTLRKLRSTRENGGRIVAVGTTSVRTLEAVAERVVNDPDGTGATAAVVGSTDIFIYPPYRFRLVDALITNFHLPESTLLMLVAAFAGKEQALALYREAAARGYRFYSYGDAMLIL